MTYNGKHNLANGEDNNDGVNHNNSWNCGQVDLSLLVPSLVSELWLHFARGSHHIYDWNDHFCNESVSKRKDDVLSIKLHNQHFGHRKTCFEGSGCIFFFPTLTFWLGGDHVVVTTPVWHHLACSPWTQWCLKFGNKFTKWSTNSTFLHLLSGISRINAALMTKTYNVAMTSDKLSKPDSMIQTWNKLSFILVFPYHLHTSIEL